MIHVRVHVDHTYLQANTKIKVLANAKHGPVSVWDLTLCVRVCFLD